MGENPSAGEEAEFRSTLERLEEMKNKQALVWIKRSDDSWVNGYIGEVAKDGTEVTVLFPDPNNPRAAGLIKKVPMESFLNWQKEKEG